MSEPAFDPIVIAIQEDIGAGDLTSDLFVPANLRALARIVTHEKAIVAGTETASQVFRHIDPGLHVEILRPDGSDINVSDVVMEVRGLARPILKGERIALNFLQHLAGVATLTRKFVDAAANNQVKILDTRKTMPGLRALEKAAVVAGGGANHRFGLFDMVLIKDNHLASNSGLSSFVETIRKLRQERPDVRIEVEADRLQQVRTFLQIEGIDLILLDNMKPAQLREAVALGKNKVKFEASGGVTLKSVRQIAATGVDYISIGALTHSARAVDFSLEMTPLSG
jgi:nicotinate-nucleotide pyrophosphorylase (carboxylating)